MAIKAILWDLDGTIADSTALHYQAWQATMHRYGVDLSYQSFIDNYGRNNAEILAEHFGAHASAMIERVAHEKEVAFRALLTPDVLQPLPGVIDWLEWFRAQRLIQVIGSSGPMANIAAITHVLGIGDYFLSLVSGVHLARGKPDPTIFLRAAQVAGVSPAQCVVIEDSIHGIEAAQRAGMHCIAVGRIARSDELRSLLAGDCAGSCIAIESLAERQAPEFLMSW